MFKEEKNVTGQEKNGAVKDIFFVQIHLKCLREIRHLEGDGTLPKGYVKLIWSLILKSFFLASFYKVYIITGFLELSSRTGIFSEGAITIKV